MFLTFDMFKRYIRIIFKNIDIKRIVKKELINYNKKN